MTALSILLKASILFSGGALVHLLFGRRMSAAARHLTWTLIVVGLLTLPVLSVVLPTWTAFTTPASNVVTPARDQQNYGRVFRRPAVSPEALKSTAESAQTPAAAPGVSWSRVLPAVYLSGVFLLLIRLFFERAAIQRLVRRSTEVTDPGWKHLLDECANAMAVRQTIRLFRSREETMPMAWGIRHGIIVIPAVADTWSEDRRKAVLLHEMAHLVRHDCSIQMLAAAACAFYWIHPGVWWIARRLRVDRELACDDRVLAAGTNARDYADHLLELAYALRSGRSTALVVSMAGSGPLEGRVLALLDAARNRAAPALRSRLVGVVILIAVLIPLAAATTAVRHSGSSQLTKIASIGQTAGIAQETIPVPDPDAPGTWELWPTDQPRIVHVRFREGHGAHSTTIDLDRVKGLPDGFPGVGGPVHFTLSRDAGDFTIEGVMRSGVGAGTYTFTASPTFAAELVKRGLERPTPGEQRMLAGADIGFAFLDELAAQRFPRPAHLAELVRAAYHGVSPEFIRELAAEGMPGLSLDDLLRARNSGVDAEYIRDLRTVGYPKLSLDALIQLRQHGVDPDYVRELDAVGYSKLPLDALIQLRQHGVDPDYVLELDAAGYSKLSLDTLTQLRNHGVDPDYVRDLAALGYQKLSLDKLIELRNHGVDPEYARELGAAGYPNLSVDSMIGLRNHGVDPEYIRQFKSLGYTQLKIDDFVRLRNLGVGPDEARAANARAGKRLTVDDLVGLAARGWR